MASIKETLDYILKAIITENSNITTYENEIDGETVIEIEAPSEITGQIIGKQGRIIKSIRTLLAIAHPQKRFSINIKD